MLKRIQAFLVVIVIALSHFSYARAGTFTGVCQCAVVKCETTLNVNGCAGTLNFGQSSESAVFCSLQGNVQSIFYKYDDYVHQRSPDITCGGENPTGTGSTTCDCSAYQGSNFGDLNVAQISTNSQGYATSKSLYGENVPKGSCYCDLYSQYSPDGKKLLPGNYYSLGSPSSPVYCMNGNEIHANANSGKLASCGTLTTVNGYLPVSQTCACSSASVAATSTTYINSTTSFNNNQPNSSLVAIVQNQMGASKNTGSGSGSSSSSSSNGSSSNGSSSNSSSSNGSGSNGSSSNGSKSILLTSYLYFAQFAALIITFSFLLL